MGSAELKQGFFIGLGVALALVVVGIFTSKIL